MSKNNKKVMEWVAASPGAFAGGAATEEETNRLKLGLRDDEIAEIHKIIVSSHMEEDFEAAKRMSLTHWVSMDPDSVYSAVSLLEDLETMLLYIRTVSSKGIAVGVEDVQKEDEERIYNFDSPLLVGTDIGIGIYGSVDVGVLESDTTAQFRVFFTRRKASAAELNQILLKRR